MYHKIYYENVQQNYHKNVIAGLLHVSVYSKQPLKFYVIESMIVQCYGKFWLL